MTGLTFAKGAGQRPKIPILKRQLTFSGAYSPSRITYGTTSTLVPSKRQGGYRTLLPRMLISSTITRCSPIGLAKLWATTLRLVGSGRPLLDYAAREPFAKESLVAGVGVEPTKPRL